MKASPGQIAAVLKVARGLGDLREEVVFVGGIVAGFLVTDPGADEARPTLDVDLVVEVTSKVDYYETLRERLLSRGFREDTREKAPLCRWIFDGEDVDVMPTDPSVLGFSNRWYPHAIATAQRLTLTDGVGSLVVKVLSAPAFLATKLAAFASRGGGDLTHPDIEDIVYLVDGRKELLSEVESDVEELRSFVAESTKGLLASGLDERVSTHLRGDFASQAREPFVLGILHRLAAL